MNNEDIFNTDDIKDLPEEISKDLLTNDFEKRIVELFNIAQGNLSIDEITVGYYRVYHDIKTRRQMMTKLYNMSKERKPKIEPVISLRGVYKLRKEVK